MLLDQESKYKKMTNAYQLALCESFCPSIHGVDNNSSPDIVNHFLVNTTIELKEFYDNSYKEDEQHIQRNWLTQNLNNYNQKNIRLEIVQMEQLTPGGEYVAYFKTFWLRIVQRRWKKVFKARKELLSKRSGIKALQEKQRTGQWPLSLRSYPVFNLFN